MPFLLGQPQPAFLEDEQPMAVRLMAINNNAMILFVRFINFKLQFKLFSQIIIAQF